jgi:hypothetical protein
MFPTKIFELCAKSVIKIHFRLLGIKRQHKWNKCNTDDKNQRMPSLRIIPNKRKIKANKTIMCMSGPGRQIK